MMQIHVSGRLVRDPAQKTSASGKAYVHTLMTAGSGDGEALITLMVFDTELSSLLASLQRGDSLSAIGSGSVKAYTNKDGQPAVGVTLMANRLMVMTDRQAAPRPKSERKPADRQQYRRTEEFLAPAGPRDFTTKPDRIPF